MIRQGIDFQSRKIVAKTYTSHIHLHKSVLLTQASSTCASQKLIWLGFHFVTFLTQTNQQYSLTQAIFKTLAIFCSSGHERRNGVIKRIGDDFTQASSTCASQKLIWLGLKKSRSDFFNPNKSAVLAYKSHIRDNSHILLKWT